MGMAGTPEEGRASQGGRKLGVGTQIAYGPPVRKYAFMQANLHAE